MHVTQVVVRFFKSLFKKKKIEQKIILNIFPHFLLGKMLRITSVFYLFAKRTSEKVKRNLTVPKVMLCLLIDWHFIKKKPGFRGEVLTP